MAFYKEPNIDFKEKEYSEKYHKMIIDGKIEEVKKLLEDKKGYLELFYKHEVDDTLENIAIIEKEIKILNKVLK